ncbi:MAG: hypothetical protein R3Y56_07470 [Akkermansia sp.]
MHSFTPRTLALCWGLLLVACQAERTIYDSSGNVVKERKLGEHSSLEERFAGGFDAKKNEQGIVEAESRKVSSFQGKLDESRAKMASEQGREYGGSHDATGWKDKSYSDAKTTFSGSKEYKDSSKSAYSTDDIPAFMKGGKGIERTEYDHVTRDLADQEKTYDVGEAYAKKMSQTSREDESQFFESRRDSAPKPTIFSKDEYTRKTVEDTRSMLRRDNALYGGE